MSLAPRAQPLATMPQQAQAPDFDQVYHAPKGSTWWGSPLPWLERDQSGKPTGLADVPWWTPRRIANLEIWLGEGSIRELVFAIIRPNRSRHYAAGRIRARIGAQAYSRARKLGDPIDILACTAPPIPDEEMPRLERGIRLLAEITALAGDPPAHLDSLQWPRWLLRRESIRDAITIRRAWPIGMDPRGHELIPPARQPVDDEQRMRDAEDAFRFNEPTPVRRRA